ncbi:MAG TPA: hypothetical protein VF487_20065 [Chitinophagaceae bacterium]
MKKIIDILAIVLPALIIMMGIIRVFVKNTKSINSLTMIFAILLLLGGLIRYYVFPDSSSDSSGPKPPPLTVSKHSELFNQSIENVLTAYYKMTDAFAGADVSAINQSATTLQLSLDSFRIEELKVDTLIYQTALQPFENVKAELVSIISDPSLEEKKGSLNVFSNELFALLSTVRYDRAKIYWLECASAFGEDKPGNWISKTEQAANPYGQKDCVELKTKIDFVPVDTTKKASDL